MNQIFFIILLSLVVSKVLAQTSPEEYLSAVPVLNINPCSASFEEKQKFREDLDKISNAMKDDMEARQQEAEQLNEANRDQERINGLIKAGYSREDAIKLQNADNMSEAELMALANQMMMNKNNMTVDDYKRAADLDTAAQLRWSKAHSTEMMADMDAEKLEKDQLALKRDIDLQVEFQFQRDKMRAGESKYIQQLDTLDKEAREARLVLEKEIEKARADLEKCETGQCEQIRERMRVLRDDFCNEFTPEYLVIIEQYRIYIEKNIPEYYKLEELQMKSLKSQTGTKDPNYKPGSMPLGMVESYISVLNDAFKYSLNNNFGGPVIR